jgi:hypothetical protein
MGHGEGNDDPSETGAAARVGAAGPAPVRSGATPPPELLSLLMPASVFLDDDIASLLGAHGGSYEGFLSIVIIPEPAWSDDVRSAAATRAQALAHEVTLVCPENAPRGRGAMLAYVQEILAEVARRCPPGGTVVLGWPGSTEEGLRFLRLIRQRFDEAHGPASTPLPEAATGVNDEHAPGGTPMARAGERSRPL